MHTIAALAGFTASEMHHPLAYWHEAFIDQQPDAMIAVTTAAPAMPRTSMPVLNRRVSIDWMSATGTTLRFPL